jgi:hypothetical protein
MITTITTLLTTLQMMCNRWLNNNSLRGPIPNLSALTNLQSLLVFSIPCVISQVIYIVSCIEVQYPIYECWIPFM